MIEVID